MDRTFWKIVVFSTLIFFFSWVIAYKSGVNQLPMQSEDTLPALFLPVTIINEGSLYLDTYFEILLENYTHPDDRARVKGLIPFYLREVNGHYLSAFPIITPLLALPFYILPVKLGLPITMENVIYLGHFSGAAIVGISGGFLYLLLMKHFSLNRKKALLLTGIYLFGTVNFAMISQALWQHGTVELLLILALWFMYEKKWFFMSFMLALAFVSRPTAILAIPFLSLIFISVAHSVKDSFVKPAIQYFAGFLPPLAFFFWYTNKFYLDLSNNGYSKQWFTGWHSKFPEGFLGMWFSPSKGILTYSPILIFALVGLWLALKNNKWKTNIHFMSFGAIVFMHTLVLSVWKHWYGGWSFGYRMASDILPFLILFMVPYVKSPLFETTKKLFKVLFGLSITIQLFGIVFFDGIWHAAYDDGFSNTKWLWSLRNSEFAFNIRRILVKFGILDRACPQCLSIYD